MWDERYASDDYRFGTRPNKFLVDCAALLKPGRALSLGEGEGRNAVYLAQLGYDVTAVDQSEVGNAKAQRLAKMKGVTLTTVTADLNDFVMIEPASWDVIIDFFCHMPQCEEGGTAPPRDCGAQTRRGLHLRSLFAAAAGTGDRRHPPPATLLFRSRKRDRSWQALTCASPVELVRHRDEDDPDSRLQAVLQVLALKKGDSP